jgi:hypothetical protein
MDVVSLLVLPNGETPFFEQVDRGVYVPGDVVYQVLAGDAHEVILYIVHIVFRGVVALFDPDILVKSG